MSNRVYVPAIVNCAGRGCEARAIVEAEVDTGWRGASYHTSVRLENGSMLTLESEIDAVPGTSGTQLRVPKPTGWVFGRDGVTSAWFCPACKEGVREE